VATPVQFPPVSRAHLDVLTGEFGIMQHAIGRRPDPAHGTCTDDVARALQVDLLHQRELGWAAVADSAARNLRYLDTALDRGTGRFRNFRRDDGAWYPQPGSEDCHGRAMLALGETIAVAPDQALTETAERLFSEALPAAQELRAMRARASVVLGCDAALRAVQALPIAIAHQRQASRLMSSFGPRSGTAWPWPEPRLTYENALPARALLVAGARLDSRPMIDVGLEALDWLILEQTASEGHYSPIGNGWWISGRKRSQFDQQPIEATAMLVTAEAALEVTGLARYRDAVGQAFAWFLGANDLRLPVADPERGAGHDGLTATGLNANQGAESTLMWLIALEHARRVGPDPRLARVGLDSLAISLA
jgi:hypothetical protein